MTGASDWQRAGIALSGVTLVLSIAAGIHFVAPARLGKIERPTARARAAVPSDANAPPDRIAQVIDPTRIDRRAPIVASRRISRPQPDSLVREAVKVETPDQVVDGPGLPAPLAADFEIPDASLRFEAMRLSVSGEFVEAPLPRVATGDESVALEPTTLRSERRGPVTAAFVTAGSAVAGGFRTAGRAVKRVF